MRFWLNISSFDVGNTLIRQISFVFLLFEVFLIYFHRLDLCSLVSMSAGVLHRWVHRSNQEPSRLTAGWEFGWLSKYFGYESDYYFHHRRPQMFKDTRSQRHNRKSTMICMTQNCIELQTKRAAQQNNRTDKTKNARCIWNLFSIDGYNFST